jgi:hypothetical protein
MIDANTIYNLDDASTNGHINRNIRASMSLIDMAKPYLVIDSIVEDKNKVDTIEVTFKINGCVTANDVSAKLNGQSSRVFSDSASGVDYCNHSN